MTSLPPSLTAATTETASFGSSPPPPLSSSSKKPRGISLNDFIKNFYGATQELEQQQEGHERETSTLLGGNSSGWHYNHNNSNTVSGFNDTPDHHGDAGSTKSGGGKSGGGRSSSTSWTLRRLALELSLWSNVFITLTKLVAYIHTTSLSVLAALLDSLLDVVSQLVLNYTEKHSSMQRSSALYPAGASRLEPIGVLTCASLMGMASFEVLKESFETLLLKDSALLEMGLEDGFRSAASMAAIVVLKVLLLWLCNAASGSGSYGRGGHAKIGSGDSTTIATTTTAAVAGHRGGIAGGGANGGDGHLGAKSLQLVSVDPTLEAVAQDHFNDVLSNGVSLVSLLLALYSKQLWWCDGVGAILISVYIIHSWYHTGKEQIEHLTGRSAPAELIEELMHLAEHFDERLLLDTCRAYHFGPKFLVELEVVMPSDTLLKESHDLGMELQYEIEAREEVERCFVHIDYESRDYDEHVVSKVPELREHLLRHRKQATTALFSATSSTNHNHNNTGSGFPAV